MKSRFYYAGDEKVFLSASHHFIAVKFSPKAEKEHCSNTVENIKELDSFDNAESYEPFGFYLLPTTGEASEGTITKVAKVLNSADEVESTMPVFQVPDGDDNEIMVLTTKFRVQFRPEVKDSAIKSMNKKHGVTVSEKEDLGANSYLLEVNSTAQNDALELANLYHESDLTEYAEPEWVFQVPRLAAVNDPLFEKQWALKKMNVSNAWKISKGSPNIKVAIIDEGVDIRHPDLKSKIVTPYDAVGDDNNQNPNSWDGHGTACAGIAAADTNNKEGVAGVASKCKILPVRIAQGRKEARGWITNSTIIARGIKKAVERGADVLSNSWGGGPYSTAIRKELKKAIEDGRNGKGCVVISATGNSDRKNIIYPAKYPESLACGASNQWDKRKSKTSLDGETWWGSNYGKELDFLAPGVKIHTTDNRGSGGYNKSGNYINTFNGTSSATPNAAGVAALILSIDPHLRHWEVADILRLTAKNLGNDGGWDEQTGWGRVDAFKALNAAKKLCYETKMKLAFLGTGQDCFMRFNLFRFFNCGINKVRLNRFTINSFDSKGNVIDTFKYEGNPGGIMNPGLSPKNEDPDDVQFKNILLKANGNRKKYSYRWSAHWNYTYWRPTKSASDLSAEATISPLFSEWNVNESEDQVSIDGASFANGNAPVNVSVDTSEAVKESLPETFEEVPNGNGTVQLENNENQVTISITVGKN